MTAVPPKKTCQYEFCPYLSSDFRGLSSGIYLADYPTDAIDSTAVELEQRADIGKPHVRSIPYCSPWQCDVRSVWRLQSQSLHTPLSTSSRDHLL